MSEQDSLSREKQLERVIDLARLAADFHIREDRPPEVAVLGLITVAAELAQEHGVDMQEVTKEAFSAHMDPSLLDEPNPYKE